MILMTDRYLNKINVQMSFLILAYLKEEQSSTSAKVSFLKKTYTMSHFILGIFKQLQGHAGKFTPGYVISNTLCIGQSKYIYLRALIQN